MTAPRAPGPGRVRVRFYGDLEPLAGARELEAPVGDPRSVKDVVESLGVPHTEVGLLAVGGSAVGFDRLVGAGERIAVYPHLRAIDVAGAALTPRPPEPRRFVCDVHLGTLTRRLRTLGFDTWYSRDADDAELSEVSVVQDRILLTRDRGLLMRRAVVHGYLPRAFDPGRQLHEVVDRFDLLPRLRPFTRCVHDNAVLVAVTKQEVLDDLPPRTRVEHDEFSRCPTCRRVYWAGSHRDAMADLIADLGAPP